jgi:hypothetical protein
MACTHYVHTRMNWISPPSPKKKDDNSLLGRSTPNCALHRSSIDHLFTPWNVRHQPRASSIPSHRPRPAQKGRKMGSAQTPTDLTVSSSLSANNHVHIGHSAPCHVCPTISTDSMVLGMIVFPFLRREVRMAVVVDDVRSSKRTPRRVGARASHHRVLVIRLCVCLIFSFLILSLLRI